MSMYALAPLWLYKTMTKVVHKYVSQGFKMLLSLLESACNIRLKIIYLW